MICKKNVFLLYLVLFIPLTTLYSQPSIDYKGIFGEKYTEALEYLTTEKWMNESLRKENIDPCFAKAIVFPELIRYSTLRDKMEMQGLFTLYVQYGSNYANFSVGHFQMKPTFVEQIEKDILKNNPGKQLKLDLDTSQNCSARLDRIKRLESPQWQLQYLIWFIHLMEKKYNRNTSLSVSEKLLFYATAYNCGFTHKKDYIELMMTQKSFHTSLFSSGTKYTYADISLFYFLSCNQHK